ncbi:thiamine-phosphate kinase [Campylobacterota bacterium]
MNKEDFFISCFNSKRIGDDAAVLDEWVVSKDAFFENVHFKRDWFELDEIAYKAMLVNISDSIAMNADPQYALLAVGIPSSLSKTDIKKLHSGFERAAKEFGIEIIGGDTISNAKIDITITVLAKCKKCLKRTGLKNGDLLAYTGSLGSSKKALDSLLRVDKARKSSRFFRPKLRKELIKKAAPSLHCGMDISDGLFSDLNKLSKVNRLGFSFLHNIPRAIGCSGEEYEMLIGFSPRARKKMIRLAAIERCELTIFAKARRNKYKSKCKAHHF